MVNFSGPAPARFARHLRKRGGGAGRHVPRPAWSVVATLLRHRPIGGSDSKAAKLESLKSKLLRPPAFPRQLSYPLRLAAHGRSPFRWPRVFLLDARKTQTDAKDFHPYSLPHFVYLASVLRSSAKMESRSISSIWGTKTLKRRTVDQTNFMLRALLRKLLRGIFTLLGLSFLVALVICFQSVGIQPNSIPRPPPFFFSLSNLPGMVVQAYNHPTIGRLRQKNHHEFEVSQDYGVRHYLQVIIIIKRKKPILSNLMLAINL